MKQAETWLRESLNKKYCPKVNKYNNKYHWTQNEFDAMVCFAYNIGSIDQLTAYGKRTKKEIAQKMLEYRGKMVSFDRRRKAEQKLFLSK